MSGAANDWPFQYHGLEHEFSDPWIPLYLTGGGQFYDAQLMRSLSETSQTSSGGGGGGGASGGGGGFSLPGMAIAPPSGSSGGLSGQSLLNDSKQAYQVGSDVFNVANGLGIGLVSPEWTMSLALPLAGIAAGVDFLVNFFEDLFGGSESPPTPRQLLHGRHPLYDWILGVSDSLTPTMKSKGKPDFCGEPQLCGTAPLQKVQYRPTPAPGAGLTKEREDQLLDLAGKLSVEQGYEMYLQGKLTEQEFYFFLFMKGGPAPTPTPTPPPGELTLWSP